MTTDKDLTPEERDARNAALQRVEELEQQAARAVEALRAMRPSDHPERQREVCSNLLFTEKALLRAYADAGRWSVPDQLAMTPAEAARTLLERRQDAAVLVPGALETLIGFAVALSDDPETREARENSRNVLLETGLVTGHELETFLEASLKAIILERFRQQEDGN